MKSPAQSKYFRPERIIMYVSRNEGEEEEEEDQGSRKVVVVTPPFVSRV